jgi:hypothetical protein
MLGYYLKFNGVDFPNPITPTMSSQTLENVATSEAGTDLVTIVRPSKKSWSLTFQLTSGKRDVLKGLCQNESTTMSYMGTNYTVRVRNYQEKLVANSEWVDRSSGLYECSVSVTEF